MVITITCPSCSTAFPVDPAKIPEGGVNARCSSCGDIFRVEKPVEAEPLPTLEDLTPETPAAPRQTPPAAPPARPPEPPATEQPAADPFAQAAPFEQAAPETEAPPPAETAEPLPAPGAEPGQPTLPVETPEPAPGPPTDGTTATPSPQPAAPEPSEPPPGDADTSAPAVQGFTFGKRDPKDKAKRLARVLVSDMIMYNAERHQSALAHGTLQQDFEEEIEKSWKEFVEQVGEELANVEGRRYWKDALNDILAKGDEVF
jgi:predicted Zn finger-like uncharacterized protein